MDCGGERRSSEWRCCVAWEVASGGGRRCGGGGRREGLFIGRERGGGVVVAGDRGAVGQRAPWAPLMAIGAAAARFAAAQG